MNQFLRYAFKISDPNIITLMLTVVAGLAMTSCTDFFSDIDLQEEWEVKESDKIVLHYRPEGFSSAASPGREAIQQILDNQNFYYQAVQDSIQRSFQDKVLIYLYNQNEAEELIGTRGGGHAIPKFNTFYYAFITERPKLTDKYHIENPVIGAHELVHIITHRTLGYPATKLMSEGYAVWLDGNYGGYTTTEIIRKYRKDAPEKIMTPNQLLNEEIDRESIYYPNAGIFIGYLVGTYGIEKVNELFNSEKEAFRENFHKITGTSWTEMNDEYRLHVQEL